MGAMASSNGLSSSPPPSGTVPAGCGDSSDDERDRETMTIALATSNQPATLPDLAVKINEAHDACVAAVRTAIRHARECGEALITAKKAVGHGNWGAWLIANCRVSPRQARNYMTVARDWSRIAELSNRNRGAVFGIESLSIKAALRLLTQDSDDWKYADQFCPACGERMVYTSRLFITCPACWDCRLYPNPKATFRGNGQINKQPYDRGGDRACREGFRRLAYPNERAEVLVELLAMLDESGAAEMTRLLQEANPTPTRRRAAELVALLHGRSEIEANA